LHRRSIETRLQKMAEMLSEQGCLSKMREMLSEMTKAIEANTELLEEKERQQKENEDSVQAVKERLSRQTKLEQKKDKKEEKQRRRQEKLRSLEFAGLFGDGVLSEQPASVAHPTQSRPRTADTAMRSHSATKSTRLQLDQLDVAFSAMHSDNESNNGRALTARETTHTAMGRHATVNGVDVRQSTPRGTSVRGAESAEQSKRVEEDGVAAAAMLQRPQTARSATRGSSMAGTISLRPIIPAVIFLDIDGVLHPSQGRGLTSLRGKGTLLSEYVKRVHDLTVQGNAIIVMTSTWRFDCAKFNSVKGCLRLHHPKPEVTMLEPNYTIPHRIDEEIEAPGERGESIICWLEHNRFQKDSSFTRFVILDDMTIQSLCGRRKKGTDQATATEQRIAHHFVQIQPEAAFSERDKKLALQILTHGPQAAPSLAHC